VTKLLVLVHSIEIALLSLFATFIMVNGSTYACLDLIRDIRDPEKPETLEQLRIVCEDDVKVKPLNSKTCVISIEFSPTVQHCSLATLIGLYHSTLILHSIVVFAIALFSGLLQIL